MHDFALALGFWLVYEAMSLPLRWALTPFGLSADLRRVLSRGVGPAALALAAGLAAHGPVAPGWVGGWILVLLAAGGALGLGFAHLGRGFFRLAAAECLPVRRGSWKCDLAIESVFLASFFGYVAFRRLVPEMTFEIQNSGAEKFPNAMLFWSCWHAPGLPPQDYWFSGLSQTYYYWGHFFWSWIGRVGGFPASTVIALGLSRVVALTVESSYLLLRAMRVSWRGAILGAVAIAWGGNPQAWVTLKSQFDAHRQGLQVDGGVSGRPEGLNPGGAVEVLSDWRWEQYSFWEPSRVMEGTVTEFPAWSAILGDFHAHHLALPWLIVWFAVLLGGDRWLLRSPGAVSRGTRRAMAALVAGVPGAMACLANLWSLPVVVASGATVFLWRRQGRAWSESLIVLTTLAGLLGMTFMLEGRHPLAPLSGGTAAEAESLLERLPLRVLPAALRSSPAELFGMWGFQIAALVMAAAFCLVRRWRSTWVAVWTLAGGLLMAMNFALPGGGFVDREEPALLWLGLGCWIAAMTGGKGARLPSRAGVAGGAACLLLAGLEFFYIQDRMTGDLARYNSYFKFSYAAWPALSAMAWVAGVKLWSVRRPPGMRFLFRGALALLLAGVSAMWIFGGPARVLQARIGEETHRQPTLNAFAWLEGRRDYRAEAAALAWIRENVPPGEVVAEAPSRAGYSYQGRVASLGGRPIPLGWGHHVAQWRGASIYDRLSKRHDAVNGFFLAGDVEAMKAAARELNIKWAILGRYEREAYGAREFGKTLEIMKRAAELRRAVPGDRPQTFVFEFRDRGEAAAAEQAAGGGSGLPGMGTDWIMGRLRAPGSGPRDRNLSDAESP